MAGVVNINIPDEATLAARDAKRRNTSSLTLWVTQGIALGVCAIVFGLIGTILFKGLPSINWGFLTADPIEGMSAGGIGPMIRGSLLLMGGTLLIVLPVGILGGIFLAEFAGRGRFYRMFHACVTALAGTPSIVYGLFGLAVFVIAYKWGNSLIAGWLTLALFSMPTIVLTTENSIRSVPDSLVEGALALGLSKWQTIWRVVLPNASPGILSGLILTTGRAAGEAPPILLTAGIYYSTEKFMMSKDVLYKPVMNLPYHLAEGYRQGGSIPEGIVWGTCLALLLFVLLINIGAIILRARMRFKQQG